MRKTVTAVALAIAATLSMSACGSDIQTGWEAGVIQAPEQPWMLQLGEDDNNTFPLENIVSGDGNPLHLCAVPADPEGQAWCRIGDYYEGPRKGVVCCAEGR